MSESGMDAGRRSAVRAVVPVQTLRVARSAARRALLHRGLALAGRGLLAGAVVGAVAVFALRGLGKLPAREGWAWSPADLSWALAAGVPMAVGALIGLAWALATRWTAEHAAWELDQRLALRDRLSSALALASGREDPEFVALALLEAEDVAEGVDPARAVGVKVDWTWSAWPVVLGGAIALGLFMPVLQHGASAAPVAKKPATAEAVQEVAKAIDEAKAVAADDPVAARQIAEGDAIEQELRTGKLDEQTARTRAASTLDKAARTLEDSAHQRQEREDELKRRLAELQKNAPVNSDLARALTKGDVAGAADEALKLSEQYNQMSPQERAALARELDQIARSMEQGEAKEAASKSGTTGEPGAQGEKSGQATRDGSESPSDLQGTPPALPPEKPARGDAAQSEQAKPPAPDTQKPPVDANPTPQPQSPAPPPSSNEPETEPSTSPADKPANQPPSGDGQPQDKQPGDRQQPAGGGERPPPQQPSSPRESGSSAQSKPSSADPNRPTGPQGDQNQQGQQGERSQQSEGQSKPGDQKQGAQSAEKQGDQKPGQERPQPGKDDQKPGRPQGGTRSLTEALKEAARQLRGEPTPRPQANKPEQKPQPQGGEKGSKPKPEAGKSDTGQQPQPGQDSKAGERPQPPQQPSGQGNPEPGQQQQGEGSQKPQDAPQPQPGQSGTGSQTTPQPDGQKQTGDAQGQGQSAENRQQQPENAQGQPRPSAGESQPGNGERQPSPGEHPKGDKPPGSPEQQQGPGAQSKPGAEDGSAQTGDQKSQQGAKSPQDRPETKSGDQQPSQHPNPGQGLSPEAIERLAKELRQYAKDAKQGDQNRQDAQRLRKQAEEILKNASPEERRMLQKLARDLAAQGQGAEPSKPSGGEQKPEASPRASPDGDQSGEKPDGGDRSKSPDQAGDQPPQGPSGHQPGAGTEHEPRAGAPHQPSGDGPASRQADQTPGGVHGGEPGSGPRRNTARGPVAEASPTQTQPVDARGQAKPSPSEHVIADYFGDKPGRGASTGPSLQQGVTDAAKGAEKAIEQQNVPSQYSDLVRRVFRRYIERVQPAGAQRQILEDAPDVPARK